MAEPQGLPERQEGGAFIETRGQAERSREVQAESLATQAGPVSRFREAGPGTDALTQPEGQVVRGFRIEAEEQRAERPVEIHHFTVTVAMAVISL